MLLQAMFPNNRSIFAHQLAFPAIRVNCETPKTKPPTEGPNLKCPRCYKNILLLNNGT